MTPQEQWDRHMLNTWFKYPKAWVYRAVHSFKDATGIYVIGSDLLRVPQAFMMRSDFRHWVSSWLPKLAEVLYNTKAGDTERQERIIAKLQTLKMDAVPPRRTRYDKEFEKLKRDNRQNVVSHTMTIKAVEKRYESQNRSSWHTCK